MGIAVIGWGSLIWCSGNLQIQTKWYRDGPELPLEFSRISADGRLTLVIDEEKGTKCKAYWAESVHACVESAAENLKDREGCSANRIHWIKANGKRCEAVSEPIRTIIENWLHSKESLSAAVWTGLPSNWEDRNKRNRAFTPYDAVEYVLERIREGDEAREKLNRIEEYIRNAPPQVRTTVRELIRKCTGWQKADLPGVLFETPENRESS